VIGMDATQLESLLDFPFHAETVDLRATGEQPHTAGATRSTELASIAVYLVLLLLLGEMALAMRFGMQRDRRERRPSTPRTQHRRHSVPEAV